MRSRQGLLAQASDSDVPGARQLSTSLFFCSAVNHLASDLMQNPPAYSPFAVGPKARGVVDHHYDPNRPGKPLGWLIGGAAIALPALILAALIAIQTFGNHAIDQTTGIVFIAVLVPIYAIGVFIFSYGYELYDMRKALRLTAIVVVISVFAVVMIAALVVVIGAMSKSRGESSGGSNSSVGYGGGGGGGGLLEGLVLGSVLNRGGNREVIREVPVPTEPPPPQPIKCPFCQQEYVPAQTEFKCPRCGGPTPESSLPVGAPQV
jgi:hypothetical protein